MGHDHIRFVLMVAFVLSLSPTCLFPCSSPHGNEMEITRFSGAYTLTHLERGVDATESITRSEGGKKVRKVGSSSSLAPNENHEKEGPASSSSKEWMTVEEFEMENPIIISSHESDGSSEQTFSTRVAIAARETSTTTHGTWTTTDQDNLVDSFPSPSQTQTGHRNRTRNNNHARQRKEFTATYSDFSVRITSSSFPVCQKVSFLLLVNVTGWTGKEKEKGERDLTIKRHQGELQLQPKHEILLDDDYPSKPIFFVYPVGPPVPTQFSRKIEGSMIETEKDDIIDYNEPTFHFGSGNSNSNTDWFLEFDPRIIGGFDSYGETVSFYFHGEERHPIIVNNKQVENFGEGSEAERESGVGGGGGGANFSSFDELCKALLLDYG